MNNSQPVQYDSEREAIEAAIALLDRMRATVAPQHPLANGVDIAVAEIRDHLARVRAAPAPVLIPEVIGPHADQAAALRAAAIRIINYAKQYHMEGARIVYIAGIIEQALGDVRKSAPAPDDTDWWSAANRALVHKYRDNEWRDEKPSASDADDEQEAMVDILRAAFPLSAPAPSPADGAVKILADLIHFKDKGDQSVGFAASQKTWDDARAFLAARAEDKP